MIQDVYNTQKILNMSQLSHEYYHYHFIVYYTELMCSMSHSFDSTWYI